MNTLINKLQAAIMESTEMMSQPLQMGELGDQMGGTIPTAPSMNSQPMSSMPMPTMNMEEAEDSEESESAEMLKSDLKTLIRNAQQMLDSINSSMEVEEWMVSKVTLATDYIVSANQYMLSDSESSAPISSMPMNSMPATPKITMDMVKPTGPTQMPIS